MRDDSSSVYSVQEETSRLSKCDSTSDAVGRVRAAIANAIDSLPIQGPISVFVHHNPLHRLEDQPFEQAVVVGGSMYDCEPYLPESQYREHWKRGRISLDDLRDVMWGDLGDRADGLVAAFGTRHTLRMAMMQMAIHDATDAELAWLLAETDLLRTFGKETPPQCRDKTIDQTKAWVMRQTIEGVSKLTFTDQTSKLRSDTDLLWWDLLHPLRTQDLETWSGARWEALVLALLWRACGGGVEKANLAATALPLPMRHRDLLLEVTGEDTDALVHEVLIRFCGVFLDQGFANLCLPDRDAGFAKAFARLYLQPLSIQPSWMRSLHDELAEIDQNDCFDPLQSITWSLEALGVDEADHDEYLSQTLLALRGWAGMIWQMETASPWLPKPAPAGSVVEFLAIRLLLDRHAISATGKRRLGTADLLEVKIRAIAAAKGVRVPSIQRRAYTVFQLAQTGGWTPEQLLAMSQSQWASLVREIESFSSLQRRRIFHLAYEQSYRVDALDAIGIHSRRRRIAELASLEPSTPSFQAIFCIDDREESMRRHVEEVAPECQTFAAAGFFAVGMYYRGADHAHYRPLCPNLITPRHYVREEPLFSTIEVNEKRAQRRRRLGRITHHVHSSSRSALGGWVTGLLGAIATFPLVARILAPGLTARVRESVGTWVRPPATELHLERASEQPGSDFDALGYSIPEMANIVVQILQDIGLIHTFSPIVLFFGHGSSSLNNPHESAYNCGACSGGRGGPNARAFAMMANDPRVRLLVSRRGIDLPDDVHFVGGYHNTCSDRVEYYDLDMIPRSHRPLFRRIQHDIDRARACNAHERCRRFESAPLDMTVADALEHVEQRGEDLSQTRPEYNHATNAMMLVGRRQWSRGLFLDRRSFLTSYDPTLDDPQATILTRILSAAIPVCAGINLEYYFSTVDNEGYGCGSKLPHNIASMLGVMTGAASDLRPGLSQQMVEIHEPMRILVVIETTPQTMLKIIAANPQIARLVQGEWVQLAVLDAAQSVIHRYVEDHFELHEARPGDLPFVDESIQWYRGNRHHLGFASIRDTSRGAS